MRRPCPLLTALLLAALAGCRTDIAGPDDPPLDLAPRVAGTWTGTYVGALGTGGPALRDTFRVTFNVRRIENAFGYDGDVRREGDGASALYYCGPAPLTVSLTRRVAFDCVQYAQAGSLRVLHVEAQVDAAYTVITGTVRDVPGAEGEQYPITLRHP